MKVFVYECFPSAARAIREEVFIREQGFEKEYDETDNTAAHILLFDDNDAPAATCRVFWNDQINAYTLGRLAVVKEHRGKNFGSIVVQEAESYVRNKGGKELVLHSQCRAAGFYRKLGFTEFGEIEEEEGCPHIWMKKCI